MAVQAVSAFKRGSSEEMLEMLESMALLAHSDERRVLKEADASDVLAAKPALSAKASSHRVPSAGVSPPSRRRS